VVIGGRQYPYECRWSGRRLHPADGHLAFDTETDLVELKQQIPRLALASASAGEQDNCLVHPDDIGRFILAHRDLHFVCHNAAFDFWVLEQHLRLRGEEDARLAWWAVVVDNRLHDSMLLDMLVRLARNDSFPEQRNLAVIAREYAHLEISKDDPYRMRYGEIIGEDWGEVEAGFFSYAIKDAIVTRLAYARLRTEAQALADDFLRDGSDVLPQAADRFGLLTESVQVKKAIALAQVSRNGMCVDLEAVRDGEAELLRHLDEVTTRLRAVCPELYKTDKQGGLRCTKAGAPSKSAKALGNQLARVREELREQAGVEPNVPLTGKTKKPTTSTKFWAEYAEQHPFLRAWVEAEELAKLLQFFRHLHEGTVHPGYTTLVRSGRTSCREPNIQQIPREGPLRPTFIASPGYYLLAVDYSYIELRTLAATCLQRYGRSDMAEVIKAGTDPHVNTAAMMLGLPLEEFKAWKNDPQRQDDYKAARQASKAVNFGVPGGLGAESLARYARATYGVSLTTEEARERRERLTGTIYRELGLYLAEDAHALVARNLKAPLKAVRDKLGDLHLTSIRKVLEGNPTKQDGQPYKEPFVRSVWKGLRSLNRNPDLAEALANELPGKELAARVCHAGVATLTGRIRGRVRYSAARNTPFQGLAADGAALALFDLVQQGFRVVGFIHDEVLVELPDEGGFVSEAKVRRVEEIMCRAMEGVLVGGIPVGSEAVLSRRWDKKAKLVVQDGRVVPWEPAQPELATGSPRRWNQLPTS
jgi:DNA polymerase I-like protein with 3'-5' exonuclease and polymerase domains